jgi:hypothetical protein
MTLGNMRAQGVRSLAVTCWLCHHGAVMSADPWPMKSACRGSARAWCAPAAASSAPKRGRMGQSGRRERREATSPEQKRIFVLASTSPPVQVS